MPKKTKRQKILAQLHRTTYSFRPLSLPPSQNTKPLITSQPAHPSVVTTPNISSSPISSSSQFEFATSIKKDLGKTVLLAGIIIIIEFALARYLP